MELNIMICNLAFQVVIFLHYRRVRIKERNSMTDQWVSVGDVARHLGVAKDSMHRWIDKKGLPAHRIGRLWKC